MPAPRILIVTASIGAGHDLPAELLAAAVRARAPAADVLVVDGLVAMGTLVARLAEGGSQLDTRAGRAAFDAEHWLIARTRTGHRLASRALLALCRRQLLALLDETRPDVVVSTYPGATELLGRLRRAGVLRVPLVSAITDLASLRWWAHPGVDLHLLTHPESEPEVRAVAGPDTQVLAVRGFSDERFLAPIDRAAARAGLGLPAGGAVVVVSGGGWGVGDLTGAARVAVGIPDVRAVVVLCGSRPGVRERVRVALADQPAAQAWGFTDRMPELLAAADALVHSTAGLTVLEAHMQGCAVVSYGWGGGHIRANNVALDRHGLAVVARTPADLDRALRTAIALHPEPSWPRHAALPAAADEVLALVARP